MAYRQLKPPKREHRVLKDTATPNVTLVQNGATAHLAVPCWYVEVREPFHPDLHDRNLHDHLGWPDPMRVDRSCQNAYHVTPHLYDHALHGWHHIGWYLDQANVSPIHLRQEGYEKVEVVFSEKIAGLEASGFISGHAPEDPKDQDWGDDWVIRYSICPNCQSAVKEDKETDYVVFVSGTVDGKKRRDVVAKGRLRIVAGPIA